MKKWQRIEVRGNGEVFVAKSLRRAAVLKQRCDTLQITPDVLVECVSSGKNQQKHLIRALIGKRKLPSIKATKMEGVLDNLESLAFNIPPEDFQDILHGTQSSASASKKTANFISSIYERPTLVPVDKLAAIVISPGPKL